MPNVNNYNYNHHEHGIGQDYGQALHSNDTDGLPKGAPITGNAASYQEAKGIRRVLGDTSLGEIRAMGEGDLEDYRTVAAVTSAAGGGDWRNRRNVLGG
jgi:hypothetical protein